MELKVMMLVVVWCCALYVSVDALNITVRLPGTGIQQSGECSTRCESDFCSAAPLLRYGKYCGVEYSGCRGENPCDGLDACCMNHDACVSSKRDYISQECSRELIECMDNFQSSRGQAFEGSTCDANDVIQTIKLAIQAALVAGGFFNRP